MAGLAALKNEQVFSVEDAEDLETADIQEILGPILSPKQKLTLEEWLRSILEESVMPEVLQKCKDMCLLSVEDLEGLWETREEADMVLRKLFKIGTANRIKRALFAHRRQ